MIAKPSMMEENKKKDRRGSIPLPAAIAATAEAARKEASRVIGEVLQQAGGSGTAPSAGSNTSNQEAMDTTGRASVPYRNFHPEGAASGANPPPHLMGVTISSRYSELSGVSMPPLEKDPRWTPSRAGASSTTTSPAPTG